MSNSADQAVVASYSSHGNAEDAVHLLSGAGLPVEKISIIGRNFETQEDVQGFYRPADAAREGAEEGAWYGGIFGLMMGAMGFFILPIAGPVFVLGPLAGLIAGAVGGAGIGALISGLTAAGVPMNQAVKYQEKLQTGELLSVQMLVRSRSRDDLRCGRWRARSGYESLLPRQPSWR